MISNLPQLLDCLFPQRTAREIRKVFLDLLARCLDVLFWDLVLKMLAGGKIAGEDKQRARWIW